MGGTTLPSAPGQWVWGREGEILACPWHGWEFDIRTGQSYCDPKKFRTRAYPVNVEPGTNVDQAIFEVNNRVQRALPRLPDEVRRNGVIVQKRSFDILLVVSMVSPGNQRDTLFLSNYASLNIVDELKRIPGIADVTIFGARDYSMRVWINPEKMARLGVTTSDVAAALRAQNAQYAAGKIGGEPALPGQSLAFTVTATGRLIEAEQQSGSVLKASRRLHVKPSPQPLT